MKLSKYILCLLVAGSLAACSSNEKKEDTEVKDPIVDQTQDEQDKENEEVEENKEEVNEEKPEEEIQPEEEEEVEEPAQQLPSEEVQPVPQEEIVPEEQSVPEATPEVQPEVEPAPQQPQDDVPAEEEPVEEDSLDQFMNKVLALDLFRMSMEYDATQISDLYGISEEDYEKAIVVKNMISPGGDEVAIFKANPDKLDAVSAGVAARDEYGKTEGAWYPQEQEMFAASKILTYGDVVIYIAARDVDTISTYATEIFG